MRCCVMSGALLSSHVLQSVDAPYRALKFLVGFVPSHEPAVTTIIAPEQKA